jgi:hypothetical protein
MRRFTLIAVLAALALLVVAPVAGAQPGGHAWYGSVYNLGGAGDESAVAVTTDAEGRPVVAGNAVTATGGVSDIRCASWDLLGLWRWTSFETTWDNPTNPGATDTVAGMVADNVRGFVYVAGTTQGAGGDNDMVLLKVADLDGEVVWAKQTGSATTDEEAEAVARDGSGNVYVTGGRERADGTWDVLTRRFDADGSVAWTMPFNSGAARFDRGLAITVRGSAVYVAGISSRRGHGDDIVLIKYTLGGSRVWARFYDDPYGRHESVSGMAVTSGAIYVCGSGKATATKPGDALLVKYASSGTLAWARWAAGNAGAGDGWTDVAVDDKGRAHVTGWQSRRMTGEDITTAMYSAAGVRSWQRGYSTAGRRMDVGTALAVEPGGRTYVCADLTDAGGHTDMVAIKYATNGDTLWDSVFPDPILYPIDPRKEIDLGDDAAVDVTFAGTLVFVVGRQVVDHEPGLDADCAIVAIER